MNIAHREQARFNMAEQQIRPWNVSDERVLAILQDLPRESFVPRDYMGLAFADTEIPLGHGQTMAPPRLEARMLQALNIKPADNILEIGSGSGFVTACLARLGNSVTSYEIIPELAELAQERLIKQGINNVQLHAKNGLDLELHKDARFDVIAITGSMPQHDNQLESLLKDKGRLFVIEGTSPVMQAMLITRQADGGVIRQVLFETDLPPLQQATQESGFIF